MSNIAARAREFDFGGTAAFRAVSLALSFAVNVGVIFTLTNAFGVDLYAGFALIASLLNLLPFADLGMGASVVNAVADRRAGRLTGRESQLHISRVRDMLTVVAAVVIVADIAVYISGGWRLILGALSTVEGIEIAAAFTIACLAASLPFGVGARVLQGNGRIRTVIQVGLLGPVVVGVGIAVLLLSGAPSQTFLLLPGLSYLVIAVATAAVARWTSGEQTLRLGLGIRRRRLDPVRAGHTAVPFLLISVGMAVGFQSHRLILAQVGSSTDVAQYSLLAQFAGPLIALTTALGQNLWGRYRTQLGQGRLTIEEFRSHLAIFTVSGTVFAIGYVFVVPVLAPIISAGLVIPTPVGVVAAALYVLVVAVHQPAAMLLNDTRGLWYQAAMVAIAAVATVAGSLSLVAWLGSAAPFTANAIAMTLLQVIPSIAIACRRVARNEARE